MGMVVEWCLMMQRKTLTSWIPMLLLHTACLTFRYVRDKWWYFSIQPDKAHDGQIFTANLANGESRIYRWADESAEPELVYAGELGGRLGDSFGVYGEDDKV